MKGLIFTEFLEMIEKKYGISTVDRLLTNSKLPSRGIYTAVGTYDFQEMIILLTGLKEESGLNVADLLRLFGRYLFISLTKKYKGLIDLYDSPLDMLEKLQSHIHVEVKKIYPKAELPDFIPDRKGKNHLVLDYYSPRKLHVLAESMMQECFLFFKVKGVIQSHEMENDVVRFDIKVYD